MSEKTFIVVRVNESDTVKVRKAIHALEMPNLQTAVFRETPSRFNGSVNLYPALEAGMGTIFDEKEV